VILCVTLAAVAVSGNSNCSFEQQLYVHARIFRSQSVKLKPNSVSAIVQATHSLLSIFHPARIAFVPTLL
jgi:hypothetical protein